MSKKNDNFNDTYNKSKTRSNIKVRNPFYKALIERLHKPLCSSEMFKIYKNNNDGAFRWEVDQICKLMPADIVAGSNQFEPSQDPAMEKIAEEANDKFLSQVMMVPSPLKLPGPLGSSKNIKPLLQSFDNSRQVTSVETGCSKVTKGDQSEEQWPLFNLKAMRFDTHVVYRPYGLRRNAASRGRPRIFTTLVQYRKLRKQKIKFRNIVDFGWPYFSPIESTTPKLYPEPTAAL